VAQRRRHPRVAYLIKADSEDHFLPYGRQSIDDSDVEAVAKVLRSDWLTTGPAVEAFERAFAERVQAREAAPRASKATAPSLPALPRSSSRSRRLRDVTGRGSSSIKCRTISGSSRPANIAARRKKAALQSRI